MITLNVNGTAHDLDISPDMPLLWVLRDRLNLTSAKFGCGRALCGACTVHIDGEAARSCSIMAGDAIRTEITTIEAVSGKVADAVKNAWQSLDVVQCGYCQTGQIMSA
ncbi:MAG: 2Fe-2S iron-sulfur cluster-binding protein, partial [Rhodoplanes sp.]